jgi:hypothetical protein
MSAQYARSAPGCRETPLAWVKVINRPLPSAGIGVETMLLSVAFLQIAALNP